MKKLIIGIVVVVVLAFGFYVFREPLYRFFDLDETPPGTMTSTLPPETVIEPQTPSVQDGDLYIEALSKKDASVCVGIKNEKIRQRCENDTKNK